MIDPIAEYGFPLAVILYFVRLLALLPLPLVVCHTLGLLLFDIYEEPELRYSPMLSPSICIRVVTRGNYPLLVCENVKRNMATCDKLGLLNFSLQVVTDKAIDFEKIKDGRVQQIIVPNSYRTSTGALFKSRALHYATENYPLNDKDWIVHIDEETVLTENCLRGILNFVNDGKYSVGQGLILYGSENVVNWITTLGDSIRVGIDLGLLRFCLKVLHAPIFLFKGSYVVIKADCERDVTFDHGIKGSIAEDMYFAMVAMTKGYKFGWIEGEMWEKSPFTLYDFIQQRKRWLQGVFLIVHDGKLSLIRRIILGIPLYAWITVPITTSNVLLTPLCPLVLHPIIKFLVGYIGAVTTYLYLIGAVRSFHLARLNYFRFALKVLGAAATIPVVVVSEVVAVIWGVFSSKHKFYVVQKQINSPVPTQHL
ncbi:unnamed protein product [Didymodactylos carnosus]|uniref:Glycosyltransferase 2-like domain-containing protein n=1 Tax=Didymodactylos carnosus TaxID=1234261 RepID=A0A815T1L0_9BILA|nr:unnamed protein product [Didymodactylos carnosus]CAF1498374.1 unnamed protein product [Didymodactylos carnosus]CAF3825808.1 unnamed protein product [Didymodactylos carnosus]CAF4360474.1 unnamed protein product [Didymodactylos carnosus]